MIYICTHTDFDGYPKEKDFEILASRELGAQYDIPVRTVSNGLNALEYAYAEGFQIYDVWKNTNDEWVGINHYRRYFDFKGEEHYVTTLPIPLSFNMHEQYARCHNITDLFECESIIDEMFPEYKCDYANINVLYANNMFILNRKDFNEYCRFVFGVLKRFGEDEGLYSQHDVNEYVRANKQFYNPKRKFDVSYQSRLFGFLMERIGTIFFLHYFKDKEVRHLPVVLTSSKIYGKGYGDK